MDVGGDQPCLWALLGGLLVLQGCTAYDPELLELRRPRASAGIGGGAGVAGGAGTRDATVRDDAAAADASPPPRDAQPPADAMTRDGAAGGGGAGSGGTGGGGGPADAGQDTGAGADAGCGDGAGDEDCCPSDPDKSAPGMCGCGIADTDGDGDGTANCLDGCPADAMKTAAGICGCGRADSDQGGAVSCAGLRDALRHRYRFDGSGTAVLDARGDQDGAVVNAALGGTGQLALAGGTSNQYVDLPNGLVSALTDATFEVWLTWNGGNAWQRIFDFGTSDAAEGSQGAGRSYLFLTPRSATNVLRVSYSVNGSTSETQVSASAALPSASMRHVAVVVDDANDQLALYLDGALVSSVALTGTLAGIADVNNWLGRSQYVSDPELAGTLHEFRIYGAALSAAQLAFSFADGPDPAYLEP